MAHPTDERKDPHINPEHLWLQLPPIFCDTYSTGISKQSNSVRIVFGEYTSREEEPIYRTSVMLSLRTVKSLIEHLRERVADLAALTESDEEAPDETPSAPD